MKNLHTTESLSLDDLLNLLRELNPLGENTAWSFARKPKLKGFQAAPEMIFFDQITNFDAEIASLLSPLRRHLSLRNVTEIDLESVKRLMEAKVGTGSLHSKFYEFGCLELGIETLDASRAAILNKSDGHLSLPNLKQIDPKAAAKLRGIPWTLLLGIETIDAETATALIDLPKKSMGRSLHLPNLRKCDTESLKILASVARNYAKNPTGYADLVLGFEEIDIEQARVLASRTQEGYSCKGLPFLRRGSVELFILVGDSWAEDTHPDLNPIYFDALERLSNEEAEVLISRVRANYFSLNGLKQLEPGVAEQLSKYRASKHAHLRLNGLQSLTPADAAHLGKLSGVDYLSLNGLQMIDSEVAVGLAGFSGVLSLDGLKSICDDSARELAKQGGLKFDTERSAYGLALNGLTELSDKAAEELSTYKGRFLKLDGLNEISATTAQSLAKYQGDLQVKRGVIRRKSNE